MFLGIYGIIVGIVVILMITGCEEFRGKFPYNYTLLIVITFAEVLLITPIAVQVEIETV